MMIRRTSICIGDIVSGGETFVYGRIPMNSPPGTPVLVGYAGPCIKTGKNADDGIIDASNAARAKASFLVTDVEVGTKTVTAVCLDKDMDYPTAKFPDKIEFTLKYGVGPDRVVKVESLNFVGVARNADDIAIGDIVKSGRFASPRILVRKANERPTAAMPTVNDHFLVTESYLTGPQLNRRYVTAVRLNGRFYDERSDRVKFYMSGDDNDAVSVFINMLPTVVLVGRVVPGSVEVQLVTEPPNLAKALSSNQAIVFNERFGSNHSH